MATFSPAFLDEVRARTPLAPLIGRRTKLQRAGRQWRACCPFHGEKTPSFYIYDDHFHCFGCGAHGDAVEVPDAAAISPLSSRRWNRLAAEAGLEVPRESPAEARTQTSYEAQKTPARRSSKPLPEMVRGAIASSGGTDGASRAATICAAAGLGPDAAIAAFRLGWSGDGPRRRACARRARLTPDTDRSRKTKPGPTGPDQEVAEDGSNRWLRLLPRPGDFPGHTTGADGTIAFGAPH